MLARGLLCRLAADVPKASTHDLPRISQLLRTTLLSGNGASQSTVGAIARAFQATILQSRRAYATARATQPTAKVKRDVKKTAAKKPAVRKPAAKKKTAAAKKPKRKTAVKKKKPAPKKKLVRKKKVLTAEEKEAALIKDLKKRALRPPKYPHNSAWTAFVTEAMKGAKAVDEARAVMKETAVKYKNLTPAEKEHYNHLAAENSAAQLAEYTRWIQQHTPEEIRKANYARTTLRRKTGRKGAKSALYARLRDDRSKGARQNPYNIFFKERFQSGDFKGIQASESAKLVGSEWKALSASEKKKYQDAAAVAKVAA